MNCRLFHENLSRLVWAMVISLLDMRLSPHSPGLPSYLVLKYYRLLPVHLILSRRGHNGEMAAMELPLFLDKVGLPLLNLCSPYNQVGHCMQHIMSMYRRVGEAKLAVWPSPFDAGRKTKCSGYVYTRRDSPCGGEAFWLPARRGVAGGMWVLGGRGSFGV